MILTAPLGAKNRKMLHQCKRLGHTCLAFQFEEDNLGNKEVTSKKSKKGSFFIFSTGISATNEGAGSCSPPGIGPKILIHPYFQVRAIFQLVSQPNCQPNRPEVETAQLKMGPKILNFENLASSVPFCNTRILIHI